MSTWHLLVVDDEPLNLEIIGEFLEDGPYCLDMAENGAMAWQALERAATPFDLVILDRMMPVMDGMQLLRQLKADSRYAHIPVIMQTAASSHEQIREGLASGCYYYLTKPYKAAALTSIVESALADLAQRRELRAEVAHIPPAPSTTQAEYPFSTLEEAHRLATLLAAHCPDPALGAMGLIELLVNAVEHGNLGITYAEKYQLKQDGCWEKEVARRQLLPQYINKKAVVSFVREADTLRFSVTDQGQGFDWRKYLDFDPDRAFDPNGRGIAMASKIAFTRLEYLGNGNQVIATIALNE